MNNEIKTAIWPEHKPWNLIWVGDDIYVETDIKLDPMPGRLAVKLCEADTQMINEYMRAAHKQSSAAHDEHSKESK